MQNHWELVDLQDPIGVSMVSINPQKSSYENQERDFMLEIISSIEESIQSLEDHKGIEYQTLLNVVLPINARYSRFVLLSINNHVEIPNISAITENLKRKVERLKKTYQA